VIDSPRVGTRMSVMIPIYLPIAMAGLGPAIHAFLPMPHQDVDARFRTGHDGV